MERTWEASRIDLAPGDGLDPSLTIDFSLSQIFADISNMLVVERLSLKLKIYTLGKITQPNQTISNFLPWVLKKKQKMHQKSLDWNRSLKKQLFLLMVSLLSSVSSVISCITVRRFKNGTPVFALFLGEILIKFDTQWEF